MIRSLNRLSGGRLALPQVTLCAVTSVNVAATIRALELCLEQVAFSKCLLLTDAAVTSDHPEMRIVPIAPIVSSAAYSDFLLTRLVDHVETSHCLVAQWDGHLLDAHRWEPEFLDYDYIGASWPQFEDGHNVGNGGFSLRSRRLMEACRSPDFRLVHPEDIAIGRANRDFLEGLGLRFAPRALADHFSAERSADIAASFGYHGSFNMPKAIGIEAFWKIYKTLDDVGTIQPDFVSLVRAVGRTRGGIRRAMRMMADRLWHRPRT